MEYKLRDDVEIVDKLEARNVIKRRKLFKYDQMKEEMNHFISDIENEGGHISGPLVYSLNNVPDDDFILDIEFIFPVEEDYLEIENAAFSTYFEIPNLIATAVDHDFETLTKVTYNELLSTLKLNDIDVNTPFYHVLSDDSTSKVTILLGYAY
ncbi:DUF5085 family protein [Streptococcus agalactiae]|uniref:DUF5085 family protein n=1 Tax=Streptococcus agalactiae TaxID=1311 RepID=UPI000309D880|nr:DUF5085 family protein [Streptococcus agalactiae]AKI57431.1 Hypothetical Protein GBS85147_1003 [Streptococcus agalactiae]EPW72687.1 hypothetical protein SAG0101_03090 [Streptococcus agalactiae BSU451]HEN0438319.1 DUF5085 family protein [Streptococcus agalactiae]HEO1986320.1 DUF5085 family protein [Streptococcus agalactiae]HEO6357376.1 DUF5085 family protein [Streptococcus agalactiae]